MTADTRTPGQATEGERLLNPREILASYGVMPNLRLRSQGYGFISGPSVDDLAQAVSDASGLPLTYDENYDRPRTVNPGDDYLTSGFHPKSQSLKDAMRGIGSASFQLVMEFPRGTDTDVARRAVEAVVAREEVPVVLRIEEEIKVQDARRRVPFLSRR